RRRPAATARRRGREPTPALPRSRRLHRVRRGGRRQRSHLRARREELARPHRPRVGAGPGGARPRALPQLLPRRLSVGAHAGARGALRHPSRGALASNPPAQRPRRRLGGDARRSRGLPVLPRRCRAARVGDPPRREPAALRHVHRLQSRSRARGDPAAIPAVALMEHWSLTAGHVPPPWALVVIVVGLSIAFAEAIASHRRWLQGIPVARARLLLALRVVGLLAVVAMAFEVTIRVDQVTPTGSRVVVLFDRSASVAVPDGVPATPRHLRARDLWRDGAAARARWAEDGLTIETRTFTDTSAP